MQIDKNRTIKYLWPVANERNVMDKPAGKKVVIIGSGIGGLSTGIILGNLGYEVTILEKNLRAGGLMGGYAREGIECPVGVHYLGSLGDGQILRRFFDYLGVTSEIPLKKMGEDGVIDRYLFDQMVTPSGTFDMPQGFDAYQENLEEAFPLERDGIAGFMRLLTDSARQLYSLDFLVADGNDFFVLDQFEPLGEILDRFGCSPGLKSVIGVPASWIGVPLAVCPAFYLNMTLASYLISSWRLCCSGREMADVFARRFEKSGGKIITRAKAHKILVESKKVLGVALASGEEVPGNSVVAAIHPQHLLPMLPLGSVRPSYRKRISNLRNTAGFLSIHATVDASTHAEIPHNLFKVQTKKDGVVADLKYYQIRASENPQKSLLSILTSGNSGVWNRWKETETGRRGEAYRDKKREVATTLIKEAENVLGSFKDLKLLDTYTPLTIRDYTNSPEGSAYGVQRSAEQLLGASLLNRTSIKGLFLAGQNVSAPGIMGTIIGSFNTVKFLIGPEEFKKSISL